MGSSIQLDHGSEMGTQYFWDALGEHEDFFPSFDPFNSHHDLGVCSGNEESMQPVSPKPLHQGSLGCVDFAIDRPMLIRGQAPNRRSVSRPA